MQAAFLIGRVWKIELRRCERKYLTRKLTPNRATFPLPFFFLFRPKNKIVRRFIEIVIHIPLRHVDLYDSVSLLSILCF